MLSLPRQVLFWVGGFCLLAVVLYLLRGILLPFVAGLVLAYLLDPIADWLEQVGFGPFRLGRLGATFVILIIFILLFVLALMIFVPLIGHQLSGFIIKFPTYIESLQILINDKAAPLIQRWGGTENVQEVQRSLGNLTGQAATWVAGVLQSVWSGGQAIVGLFALLILTPVVAFYLLVDWDHMVAVVDSWLPRKHLETIRSLARQIDTAIAGFVRGQALVCFLLGTFYAIGLSILGLNFGALIGLTSGILTFIPYVGSLTGLVLAVGVALVQFWPDWVMIGAVIGVFAVGQFIEGNILSPKLVGASVGLHPVWLMFALFAFGTLFGFVGLLMAVPIAAAIGVLSRFAIAQYLKSPLYAPHGYRLTDVDGV
jgi:predicted PurR-regulated permease PerM